MGFCQVLSFDTVILNTVFDRIKGGDVPRKSLFFLLTRALLSFARGGNSLLIDERKVVSKTSLANAYAICGLIIV